mgnify:CR=1 FL=1
MKKIRKKKIKKVRDDKQPLWVVIVTTLGVILFFYLFSIPSGDSSGSGFFGLH